MDVESSILDGVKSKLPFVFTDYLDDIVVLGIVGGYMYGKVTGVEVFTDEVLYIAITYALSKELNA